ncbi:hypothetical protein O7635_32170 [Asanoa sp. WMMD1127]|uniref:hypothetical protein n=1 Tax=Asanoa sp. WMMD1127 TaxID=3016107 RepID=UPI0024162270|nr:hypothetical protein [Asanoa sp. WMMD1127]MDG4826531.1 hypothetical protein [Asanoa sp. WMMD1127]
MEPHLAYLDAGSGSLIVQAVVAGTAGVVVAAKLYWRRLTSVFRRKTPAESSATSAPAAETTTPATADKD